MNTVEEINNLITNQAEETIHLEFKRGDALKKEEKSKREIAKDVSAFANSDGGIIIYGIEEVNNKAHSLKFVNGKEIPKEWLEQIIDSSIQRRIEGLTIDVIRYNGEVEKSIYVVKIPRSSNAPHQANKRYYKRHNFLSSEMDEYEIRDLYNRVSATNLKIATPNLICKNGATQGGKYLFYTIDINFDIQNLSNSIERFYKLEITVPSKLIYDSQRYNLNDKLFECKIRTDGNNIVYLISNLPPIFQQEKTTVGVLSAYLTKSNIIDVINNPIKLKLYYSNGLEEANLNIIQLIKPQIVLGIDDFHG